MLRKNERGLGLSEVLIFTALMILGLGLIGLIMPWTTRMHATGALALASQAGERLRIEIEDEASTGADHEFVLELPKCVGITFNREGGGKVKSFTLTAVNPGSGETLEKNFQLPDIELYVIDERQYYEVLRDRPSAANFRSIGGDIAIEETTGMNALRMREIKIEFMTVREDPPYIVMFFVVDNDAS